MNLQGMILNEKTIPKGYLIPLRWHILASKPGWMAISRSGFLNLGAVEIWGQKILLWGFSCGSKMFGSTLGLYPLDTSNNTSSHPWNFDNQKYVHILPNVPWGVKLPWLRTTGIGNDRGRREIIPIEKEGNMCAYWRNWVNLQVKYEKH